MSDIEKDIKNIEQYINLVLDKGYCDCNELNVISTGKYCDGSKNVAYSMQNILAERKQDKARIKELENRLRDINTYILINGIDEPLKTATQIKVENQQQYIIQEKINLLKKKLENSIPKQKVKDLIKNETINISGFECIAVEDLIELTEDK